MGKYFLRLHTVRYSLPGLIKNLTHLPGIPLVEPAPTFSSVLKNIEGGLFLSALGKTFGTPVMETTSRRKIERIRDHPGNNLKPFPILPDIGYGAQKPPGVRVLRILEKRYYRGFFHRFSRIHHHHMLSGLCDNSEIVGDKHDR
jgi:hypothetical protein